MLKRLVVILIIISATGWAAYAGVKAYYTPASGARDIVIYTTQWCPYCKALRNTLERYQIPYTEYDTEKSLHGLLAYQVLGRQGVPVGRSRSSGSPVLCIHCLSCRSRS